MSSLERVSEYRGFGLERFHCTSQYTSFEIIEYFGYRNIFPGPRGVLLFHPT